MSEFEGFDPEASAAPPTDDDDTDAVVAPDEPDGLVADDSKVADALASLVPASALEEEEPEPAELGFEPGNLYKGFPMVPDPGIEMHAHLERRFYVGSPKGTVGLVPWAGSTIIWPWEAAWAQDLYHEAQTPRKQAIMEAFAKSHAKKEKGA